jgi:hypothetical protein
LSGGKEGELERRTWGIERECCGCQSAVRGSGGNRGRFPVRERWGERLEESDDRWVPPVIREREGEGYPFGI